MKSSNNHYQFRSRVWLYPGMDAWHFVSVPKKLSEQIDKIYALNKRGWGSLPVNVIIGKTSWKTSIFPDKKSQTYLLPLKAQVRKTENIKVGDSLKITLEVIE